MTDENKPRNLGELVGAASMLWKPKPTGEFQSSEAAKLVTDYESKMLSACRVSELLDYATSYGEMDENTPNGTVTESSAKPMCDERRATIIAYKKVLKLLPI